MEETKIIKLETSTKVLFSLFNFFAPIAAVAIVLCSMKLYTVMALLAGIISFFAGLFCLIINLIKYNRFLCITNDTINICSGSVKQPKLLRQLSVAKIKPQPHHGYGISIKYENRKVELLHTISSLLGIVCFIGPLVVFPLLKNTNVTSHKTFEIAQVLPDLFEEAPKQPSKTTDNMVNFFAWLFVLFVTFLGVLGTFLIPFYPFLAE